MKFDKYAIRLLNQEDLEPFFQLIEHNRSRLEDFFSGTVARTRTFEDTKVYVTEIIKKAEEKTYFPFLIIDTTDNSPAGFLDIKHIDWNIPKGELGFFMDKKYAGKGIAGKAFALFTDYCFTKFNFKKLLLRTHHSNIPMQKVAEKCGFETEGIIRRDYKTTAGETMDLIYYGKLSDS